MPVVVAAVSAAFIAVVAVLVAIALWRRARRRADHVRPVELPGPLLPAADAGPERLHAPAMHLVLRVQPIVLVHGLLGFDHLALLGQRIVYFRGVADALRERGATVYTARLPALASVPERARALAALIHSLPCERVNLIAHSMGGLDSRYAIARLGLADRVTSLTTIATPHRGTPLADILADMGGLLPVRLLRGLVGRAGLDTGAIDWLSSDGTRALTADIDDVAHILYGSVVGRAHPDAIRGNPVLFSGYQYIVDKAGDNDGMVPVTSQAWGEVFEEIDADHWAQIGWSGYYDAIGLYQRLIDQLRRRGL